MPEGPSIRLMKENLQKFIGEKIIGVSGNAKIEKGVLNGEILQEIRTFGKQTYLVLGEISVRIHLLMFGSYSIDEQIRPDKSLRLRLKFSSGEMFFYTCSVKIVDQDYLREIPWEADVMSGEWNESVTEEKLKTYGEEMVCDVLLDQNVFSGVGNIIKNEVLFRIKVHPETLLKNLPEFKLRKMIEEARNYSFDFLEWKRNFVLKKNWLVHTKIVCPDCGGKLTKKNTGKGFRRSFFCKRDQMLY